MTGIDGFVERAEGQGDEHPNTKAIALGRLVIRDADDPRMSIQCEHPADLEVWR